MAAPTIRISQLPAASAAASTDELEANQGGVTRKLTVTQIINSAIGNVTAAATGIIGWLTRSSITSPANGTILLTNDAGTDFTMLQFGGTSASFPALKRASTTLDARSASDTVYVPFRALNFTALPSTAVAAGVATQFFVKASSTANLGVFYGTGAPAFSAAKGSLYTNTTATTTTTRLYVNSDGATTWASLTTSV